MWIGLPLGVVMMLVVAAHVTVIGETTNPASRRRIRQANGGLMLVLIPLLTAGFSLIDPQRDPRLWVLVWLAALPMLCFVVLFAGLDVLNTWRLLRRRRLKLQAELATLEALGRRALREREGQAGEAGMLGGGDGA
jgi:hypothetical protein